MARWKCGTAPANAFIRWNVQLAGQCRKLSPSAELMVDPDRGREVSDQGHGSRRCRSLPLDRLRCLESPIQWL